MKRPPVQLGVSTPSADEDQPKAERWARTDTDRERSPKMNGFRAVHLSVACIHPLLRSLSVNRVYDLE